MQSLNTDIDSIGGGGLGGFGNNPLLWLITLGFLKDGTLGGNNNQGGVLAGEAQAKLDCLQQGQEVLRAQAADNNISAQFNNLSNEIRAASVESRDSRDLTTGQLTTLAQSLASCCCDLKTGQQSIKTDVAMQTAQLLQAGTSNTQAILDKLCENQAAIKDAEIRRLQDALQTQTIIANCNGSSGGHDIDINVLARALQGQAQAA
ncbi:hypothetical protein NVP1238A_28 [Vibrio phage 1.238.A._10N.261.52.F10]|uniref:Coil containing protein n=2 Tax=Pariacacavirus TaxID=2948856 RepID=A0A2I7RUF1_9CAUD|nr:hypothetical protein KNT79_gp28 [Vibrio phage 1.238.A._10N.261.52.F10]YP_010093475.1 hypothetical protein KNT80_gp32 [Vibrio phage 1.245.O._10N.261.54.C7]AUR97277.1 hypothetical protein NVP1238A_28 [Vibrio phage 1.238.A._10N.261.52.F10]AUR97371.1 hypothetical protein NVP1238B_29 [Vibrio phage 1.238.B._10N.261.52.F10]AUR97945.1 hypothetical protein NVP1245O_32 [Vibrio phage 1.245.O._10N.261.54.C7]